MQKTANLYLSPAGEAIRSGCTVSTQNRPPLANFAVALAAGIAMFTYAGGLANPAAGAETHYLAVWATAVLLALAGLAVQPALDLAGAAVLTTLVVWVVPYGPTRGAAIGLLLTMAFAAIEFRYLEKTGSKLTWTWAVATAMGLQFLCRADRFLTLAVEPSVLVAVVALPVAAAVLFIVLQQREGILPSLLALTTAALLVPGWSVTVILSLSAVGGGVLWRNRLAARWLMVSLAVAVVFAGYWWQPSLAWLLLLVILAKALPGNWITGITAVLATGVLVVFLPSVRDWSEVARLMALGPILLPALLLPTDSRRANSIQALVLAVLALRTVAGPAALAAPLALGALSLRSRAVAAHLQLLWSGVLLAGVALLGAYPWLRTQALEDALAIFGLHVSWPSAIAVAAMLWVLTFLCAALADRSNRLESKPAVIGGLVLLLLAWIALPPRATRPLADSIHVLSASQGALAVELDGPIQTSSVVIDSYLENSVSLPTGTPVGRLTLVGADGEHRSRLLRAGLETGEWAARRPDVADHPGFRAPPHWLAWVTADGDLFAQRYRFEWRLDRSPDIVQFKIERLDDLPAEVSLAIFHLELRR